MSPIYIYASEWSTLESGTRVDVIRPNFPFLFHPFTSILFFYIPLNIFSIPFLIIFVLSFHPLYVSLFFSLFLSRYLYLFIIYIYVYVYIYIYILSNFFVCRSYSHFIPLVLSVHVDILSIFRASTGFASFLFLSFLLMYMPAKLPISLIFH